MLGGFYGWGAGTGALRRVYRASWLWLLWVFDFTAPNYIHPLISMLHLYCILPAQISQGASLLSNDQWDSTNSPASSIWKGTPQCLYSVHQVSVLSIIPNLQEPCPNGACHDPRLAFSPVLLLQVARLFWTNLATMGAACVLDSGLLQIRVIQLKAWAFN